MIKRLRDGRIIYTPKNINISGMTIITNRIRIRTLAVALMPSERFGMLPTTLKALVQCGQL